MHNRTLRLISFAIFIIPVQQYGFSRTGTVCVTPFSQSCLLYVSDPIWYTYTTVDMCPLPKQASISLWNKCATKLCLSLLGFLRHTYPTVRTLTYVQMESIGKVQEKKNFHGMRTKRGRGEKKGKRYQTER